MSEKIVISIVVPVFNVEKELDRCISSLLNQTYSQIEVILVDDGSWDNSSSMCDKYAESDDRVIVIHKENGGLSSARNEGLKRATGKYIMYVDSDDFIELDTCERFLEYADDDVDFVVGVGKLIKNETQHMLKHSNIIPGKKYEAKDFAIKSIKNAEWHASACLNLYSRKYLLNNKLFYKEGILYEDTYMLPDLYLRARCIVYMDYPFYNYIIRENSIMTSENILEKQRMCINTYNRWFDIINKVDDECFQSYLYGALVNFYLWSCRDLKINGWHVDNLGFFFSLRYAQGIKEKMKVILFQLCPKIYLKFDI